MSLNSTPTAERVHIGIFGRRNAGKSSLINAITAQELAIVSEIKGTTTDPVSKAMELLPLGPVVFIDTPGLDDEGELGRLRVEKTYQVLAKCDVALLVVSAQEGIQQEDLALWQELEKRGLPALLVINKIELLEDMPKALLAMQAMKLTKHCLMVSAATGEGIKELKEGIAVLQPRESEKRLVGDLLEPADVVILVTPIDSSAPKGRMILPQQQVLRDALDSNAIALVVQVSELASALAKLNLPPKLVITDSQAFGRVSQIVPPTIPLTSFSILMARYKGNLAQAVAAVRALDGLRDGDRVLISEGCTHHRQCQDIGTVKMPGWVREYSKAKPEFSFTSGGEFPEDLSDYKLVIHCGACMLNEKEITRRYKLAEAQGVPITNYGIAIAYMHGILRRTVAPLPDIAKLLE